MEKKTPNRKKETIIGSIEDGVLKIVDVHKMNVAAKCAWKKQLVNSDNLTLNVIHQ